MSPVKASSSFLSRLEGSRLLSNEQLQAAVAVAGEEEEALAEHLHQAGLLTRFQIRQLRAGSTSLSVGKYIVVDYLGRGSNGIVLKARHQLMPNRYVAIKTIDTRSLHQSDNAMARFRREIDIVSQLDHPNIVRAVDVIKTRTHWYLVLECVEGKTLSDLVQKRGKLPVHEAINYIVQAAHGLAYAHEHGIVHRDIKPSNLLLTDQGVVKLTDLGLSRNYLDQNSGLTMKGAALGTPEFMAPEQAEDARSVDPRCDLYSLGATLFHLLSGDLPIEGSSYLHKLKNLLTKNPRPILEVRPDIPADLARIIDRLRSRAPTDRPQTAREVIALLEPFLEESKPPPKEKPTPAQLFDLVVGVLKGEQKTADICQQYAITESEFNVHINQFLEGGRRALDPDNAASLAEKEIQQLYAKIGAQEMQIEELKRQMAQQV